MDGHIGYTLGHGGDHIAIYVTGAPVLEDFKQMVSELTIGSTYQPGMNILCDLSEADLDHMTDLQYLSFRTYTVAHFPRPAPNKIAIIGGKLHSKGTLSAIRKSLVCENVRAFYKLEDALNWFEPEEESIPTLVATV